MANRRLKNAGRKKAFFGAEAAAILAAAGINAATQMAAAGINSAATKQAAKDQAAAVNASARQQAQAIKDQTARSKEYQEMSQEFISEQNAENRELQKDIQMQLQMLTGAQNVNDRLEASKIKVRNGGSTRPRFIGGGKKKIYRTVTNNKGDVTTEISVPGGYIAETITNKGDTIYKRPSDSWWNPFARESARRTNKGAASAEYRKLQKAYRDAYEGSVESGNIGFSRAKDFINSLLGTTFAYGGRRRLGNPTSLLQGSYNMPFKVTDGGSVVALGTTPEGYDLYEIYGNDHEHYHKAQGGKNKTGVGIKFADGNVIEGEGNQNGTKGEKMLVTPNNAYFISRHTMKGFNPAKAVDEGLDPMQAYMLQEAIKAENGISDDGKNNSPVRRYMIGGQPNIYDMANQTGPQIGVDTLGDTTVGVAYASNADTKRRLRCGGKARRKAETGLKVGNRYWDWSSGNWVTASDEKGYSGPVSYENQPTTVPAGTVVNVSSPSSTAAAQSQPKQNFWSRAGGWINNNADLVGAGIGAIGNLGAALLTSGANRRAARTLADAYAKAGDITAEAYRSLSTIDMNSLKRENFVSNAHAMPALQAPVSQAQQAIAGVNRDLERRLENAARYSASGAAANNRIARAMTDAQDARNAIYSKDQELMQNIRQGNAERVTQAAMRNAELDMQANRDYTGAYLNLLQYNNDIENTKILGAAGAISDAATNGAGALSQAYTANASAWANALTGSSQGFANSLSNMATRRADLQKVLLGASGDSQASYFANPNLSTDREAAAEYNRLLTQYNSIKNSTNKGDKDTAAILKRRINNIASGRGFELV